MTLFSVTMLVPPMANPVIDFDRYVMKRVQCQQSTA
jgi:hypothetical protein